jgi:hypothetical protein
MKLYSSKKEVIIHQEVSFNPEVEKIIKDFLTSRIGVSKAKDLAGVTTSSIYSASCAYIRQAIKNGKINID